MNILLASTSTLFGGEYLEYLKEELIDLYKGIDEIIFIPFARPGGISHDDYTAKAQSFFETINIKIKGLHEFDNKTEALHSAKGYFTGGGNTFLLVTQLYKNNIIQLLAETVKNGTPYLGTSAGSNICGLSMQTTNDMPIIYPPSFQTLGLIPFNLNPHYLDPDMQSKHMGETRETRIKEFHAFNAIPVLGLREGSWLEVKGDKITLKGSLTARLFLQNQTPKELESESDLSSLK